MRREPLDVFRIIRWVLTFCALLITILAGGCYHPWNEVPSADYDSSTTDSSGAATLEVAGSILEVKVVDENGAPVPNLTVQAFVLKDSVLIAAGGEDYYPAFHILPLTNLAPTGIAQQPKLALATITLMVIAAYNIGSILYDYYKNPGEFPIQIPGLIEGERKVRSVCVQIDGNDIKALVDFIMATQLMYKGIQVLGAPPRLRGVTAMNFGMTKKRILEEIASTGIELVAEKIKKISQVLDIDFLTTCKYYYDTGTGEVEMPFVTLDVHRPPYALFWIYVHDTGVKKGWNWLVMPDGQLVSVPEGKYVQVIELEPGKKWSIGFEDLTAELPEGGIDWDYDDPLLEVERMGESKLLVKGVRFEGIYRHDLYYLDRLVYKDFGAGTYTDYGSWIIDIDQGGGGS